MEVELFAFPTMENPKAVEDTFCDLPSLFLICTTGPLSINKPAI